MTTADGRGTYRRQPGTARTYVCRCARCEASYQLELDETQRHWQIQGLLRKAGWATRSKAWHCPACVAAMPIRRSRPMTEQPERNQ